MSNVLIELQAPMQDLRAGLGAQVWDICRGSQVYENLEVGDVALLSSRVDGDDGRPIVAAVFDLDAGSLPGLCKAYAGRSYEVLCGQTSVSHLPAFIKAKLELEGYKVDDRDIFSAVGLVILRPEPQSKPEEVTS